MTPTWQRAADAAERFSALTLARRIPTGAPHAAWGEPGYPVVVTVSPEPPSAALIEAAHDAGLALATTAQHPEAARLGWVGGLVRSEWIGAGWAP